MKSTGLLLRVFIAGIVALMPAITLAQGNDAANNKDSWSKDIVPNCQQAIRNQVTSRFNGTISFNSKTTTKRGGSNVVVNGRARVQASNQRSGNIDYHCTVQPDGKVVDSNFNVTSGNLPGGTPQTR